MSDTALRVASPSRATSPVPTAPRRFRVDDRYIAPIFITLILVVAHFAYGILESPVKTATAILASIATEIVLGRVFSGKWPHLASAYVSGISVGILLRSTDLWPYALCSALAVTSKYLIRVDGRHIWNPSNFAICALLVLAHDKVATLSQQWDNRIWAMVVIWGVGSIIIYRLRRFHITLTYVVSFIVLSWVRTLFTHDPFLSEVAPITGPMYQLFIFFMITDPKSTLTTKYGQMAVAFSVAVVEMILRLNHNVHAPYFALTMVGPTACLIEIMILRHKRRLLAARPALA